MDGRFRDEETRGASHQGTVSTSNQRPEDKPRRRRESGAPRAPHQELRLRVKQTTYVICGLTWAISCLLLDFIPTHPQPQLILVLVFPDWSAFLSSAPRDWKKHQRGFSLVVGAAFYPVITCDSRQRIPRENLPSGRWKIPHYDGITGKNGFIPPLPLPPLIFTVSSSSTHGWKAVIWSQFNTNPHVGCIIQLLRDRCSIIQKLPGSSLCQRQSHWIHAFLFFFLLKVIGFTTSVWVDFSFCLDCYWEFCSLLVSSLLFFFKR